MNLNGINDRLWYETNTLENKIVYKLSIFISRQTLYKITNKLHFIFRQRLYQTWDKESWAKESSNPKKNQTKMLRGREIRRERERELTWSMDGGLFVACDEVKTMKNWRWRWWCQWKKIWNWNSKTLDTEIKIGCIVDSTLCKKGLCLWVIFFGFGPSVCTHPSRPWMSPDEYH